MWNAGNLSGDAYLKEITAVGYLPQTGTKGYSEPTFAAFYPNCMSVFGFYDSEITDISMNPVYEVLGIYTQTESDFWRTFYQDFKHRYPQNDAFIPQLTEKLAEDFFLANQTGIGRRKSGPISDGVLWKKTVLRFFRHLLLIALEWPWEIQEQRLFLPI